MLTDTIIKKALEKREHLFQSPDTTAFRLFNGAGDGCAGLTVDLYGEYLLIQYFADFPDDRLRRLARLFQKTLGGLPVQIQGVLLKNRLKHTGKDDIAKSRISLLLEGGPPPAEYTVLQSGIHAGVDLMKGQNSGLFLDMREIREKLLSYYPEGKSMLNLFAYTGLFSLHALKNGMGTAVNVDLSKAVLKRAKKNYILNDLKTDARDFVYGDARQWVRAFKKKGASFSFIVLDPPTFARSKKGIFSVKYDYASLLKELQPLVHNGYILTCINAASITSAEYLSYHPASWKREFFAHESGDFPHPGNPYLKAGLWRVKKT